MIPNATKVAGAWAAAGSTVAPAALPVTRDRAQAHCAAEPSTVAADAAALITD